MARYAVTNAFGQSFDTSLTEGWGLLDPGSHIANSQDNGTSLVFEVGGVSDHRTVTAAYHALSDRQTIRIDEVQIYRNGEMIFMAADLNYDVTADQLHNPTTWTFPTTADDIFYGNDFSDNLDGGSGNDTLF